MNEIDTRLNQCRSDIKKLQGEETRLLREKTDSEKVDWRTLELGTLIKSKVGETAVVFYDCKAHCKKLLWCFYKSGAQHDLETMWRLESDFDNCKVVGKIKFVVKEI
jgi:hypothetical protein